MKHQVFGELKKDEFDEYRAIQKICFANIESEVEISFDQDEISSKHIDAYLNFTNKLDEITPHILEKIIEAQNEDWDFTDHTMSFKYFETFEDVIQNTTLLEIALQEELHGGVSSSRGYKSVLEESNGIEPERFLVLVFHAEWVNDDYRLLSVALANEKVVYVTSENITV